MLPQVGNYGALIDPSAKFYKLHIVKNATYFQLASRRMIAKRVSSCCKDDFSPNKIDKQILEKLSKCVNYDVQATIELAKLKSHIFQHGNVLKVPHAFEANNVNRHYKIMQ